MTTSRETPFAVLGGAGAMGRAAVYDLTRDGARVLVIDTDLAAARRIARRYGHGRAKAVLLDASDAGSLGRALAGVKVLVNSAPYRLNLTIMDASLAAGCHYVDLGGLFHTTRLQLKRHAEFQRAGLLALLGMGSAPGIANVLARAGAEGLSRVRRIGVYNGGADFTTYDAPVAFGFSPATILDELTQPPMVFEDGRFRAAAPLSGREPYRFDLGLQQVHLSLHSEVATLPLRYRAQGLRECTFKIAYDPELLARMKLLIDLGLTDPTVGPRGVSPRDVLLDSFRRMPPPPDVIDDRDEVSVVVEGEDGQGAVTVTKRITALPQVDPPLSAVARDTGFPPAIVARMILDGTITDRGVHAPEDCVPVAPFLAALAERGMRVRTSRKRESPRGRTPTPSAGRSGRGTSRASLR